MFSQGITIDYQTGVQEKLLKVNGTYGISEEKDHSDYHQNDTRKKNMF